MQQDTGSERKTASKGLKNIIFRGLGLLSLGLGILGIPLPILPSTPFFLLALFFFSTSSPGLSRWMRKKPFIARRLDRLERGEGLSIKDKLATWSLAFLLLCPVIIFSSSWHLRIFLILLLLAKAVFFIVWRPKAKLDQEVLNPASDEQ